MADAAVGGVYDPNRTYTNTGGGGTSGQAIASPTITSPSISAPTITGGGTLSGTFAAATSSDLVFNTVTDNKSVKLNSRNFTQASGDTIGYRSNPSQTVTTTGAVYGTQVSPRLQDAIAAAALVAVQGAPVLKGNTGNISGDVRAFEASIDLNNAASGRTISGVVSALYAYLQSSNSTTYTGGCAVIHVPVEDTHKWDHFANFASGVGFVNTTASVGAQIGQILVKVGSTVRCIPYYATS